MTIAERFARRFHGLTRAHGTYVVEGASKKGTKLTGRARTVKEEVTVETWKSHLSGEVGLGIVPIDDNGVCRFAAIDVDEYTLDLKALDARIREAGFPLVVCRTKSGGAHLYVFFSEPAPAGRVRNVLMEWTVALGYPKTEIFPKQSELGSEDDVGNWINVPYFNGNRTTRYALAEGKTLSAKEFLDHADRIATTIEKTEALEIVADEKLEEAPPCLQHLAARGFPRGTRNKALFNLAVYCRTRFGDEWKARVDEYNRAYLKPSLSSAEVETIVGSVDKKAYFYTCKESPIVDACNRAICLRRKYGIGGSRRDPGVSMDGLTKICTKPPTWLVNVDGRRLLMDSTSDLLDQARFVRLCVENLSVLPQRVSRGVWDDHIRTLLERLEVVDAPEDAGVEGQFLALLERFCDGSEVPKARHREELLIGKPREENGIVYFRSSDMLKFIERHRLRIGAREAWRILREELKAQPRAIKIKGKCVKCWGVPAYAAPDGELEPVEIPDEEEKF